MADFERLEVWTDVQAAGGRRLALVRAPLELTERVQHREHTVTVELPFDHPAVVTLDTPEGDENLRQNRVLRVVLSSREWTEHRIAETTRSRSAVGARRRIVARGIIADLAQRGMITRYIGNGIREITFDMLGLTAREHWNQFIYPALVEAGQPWWNLAIEIPVTTEGRPVDVQYDRDTPLSALDKIARELGGLEMRVHGDAEKYSVILEPQIGADAPRLVVRSNRNLLDVAVTEANIDQATRVYPIGPASEGGRATMADAEWRLVGNDPARADHPSDAGLELATLKLLDEAGGPGPIGFAGQWLPVAGEFHYALQWLTEDDGTGGRFSRAIYATDPAEQTVTLLVAAGEAIPHQSWHRVRFVRSTVAPIPVGYEGVNYVEHPEHMPRSGVLVAALEVPDVPATNNLIRNPLGRTWPIGSVLPTGWTLAPGTPNTAIERATTPGDWTTAGQAIKAFLEAPTHGVRTPIVLTDVSPAGFLSYFARLKTLAGAVRVRLTFRGVVVDPNTGTTSPSGFTVTLPDSFADPEPAKTTALSLWQDIGIAAVWDFAEVLGFGEMWLDIVPLDASTPTQNNIVLIDAVQLTNTPDQRPLLEGNAGVRLFQAGNNRLARYAEPAVSISANLLDLTSLDPIAFPYDTFTHGGPVNIIEPETGINVTTRIAGWTRDRLRKLNTRLDVSSARGDLTAILAQRAGTRATRVRPS